MKYHSRKIAFAALFAFTTSGIPFFPIMAESGNSEVKSVQQQKKENSNRNGYRHIGWFSYYWS